MSLVLEMRMLEAINDALLLSCGASPCNLSCAAECFAIKLITVRATQDGESAKDNHREPIRRSEDSRRIKRRRGTVAVADARAWDDVHQSPLKHHHRPETRAYHRPGAFRLQTI